MKVNKINESINNLNRVVNNSLINAVTEMPPVMGDAYEDSIEADKQIEDELNEFDAKIKDKPFLGAKDQPLPKDPEVPTVLEESLFEDWDSCNDDKEWCEWKKDELLSKGQETWDETDWDAWYYINNQDATNEFDEELKDDDYFDFVHDLNSAIHRVCSNHYKKGKNIERHDLEVAIDFLLSQIDWDDFSDYMHESLNEDHVSRFYADKLFQWIDEGKINEHMLLKDLVYDWLNEEELSDYMSSHGFLVFLDDEENDVEKSLNEDGRQSSKLKQYSDKDIEEEEVDLWTQVYSSLIDHPDEATWKAVKKKNTVILPKKQRYKVINTDSDGNIIVYGQKDTDLDPAKKVADHYGLKYNITESPAHWTVKHPEQRFSLTIKIPQENVYNAD